MKKRVVALVLAVLTMVLAFGFAGCTTTPTTDGEEKTDWAYIEEKGELVIGITLYKPMNFEDAKGDYTGFETEFAEAVCAKLGVKPNFQKIDWNSKVQELKSKNIDVIWNGMTVRDELLAEMDVSNSYMRNAQTAVIRKADAAKYKDLASMAGALVVAEAGSAGEAVVKADAGLSQKYTPVDLQSKTFTEVKSMTADIGVVDIVTAVGTIGDGTSYNDLMIVEGIALGEPEEYAIGLRKGETELAAKLNAAIKELYDDGTLSKLAEKYGLADRLIAQ